ncbi:MAG TPA: hypothetical protein VD836_16305 [Solirubrobacteraceae bacterium]|nr:hypothetical protein [Solirubrobacteraceae bacterium]
MRVLPLILVLAVMTAAGCGGDDSPGEPPRAPRASAEPSAPPATTPAPRPPRAVERARCPEGQDGCREATGRVLYVEAVDPDGDGDAHFVLAGGRITAPGISTVAVRAELRPRRLPRVGDWVSAAGVVWTGSYGQRQIEADVLHVARG